MGKNTAQCSRASVLLIVFCVQGRRRVAEGPRGAGRCAPLPLAEPPRGAACREPEPGDLSEGSPVVCISVANAENTRFLLSLELSLSFKFHFPLIDQGLAKPLGENETSQTRWIIHDGRLHFIPAVLSNFPPARGQPDSARRPGSGPRPHAATTAARWQHSPTERGWPRRPTVSRCLSPRPGARSARDVAAAGCCRLPPPSFAHPPGSAARSGRFPPDRRPAPGISFIPADSGCPIKARSRPSRGALIWGSFMTLCKCAKFLIRLARQPGAALAPRSLHASLCFTAQQAALLLWRQCRLCLRCHVVASASRALRLRGRDGAPGSVEPE